MTCYLRVLQGRLMGISGHAHLQLWPVALLRVAYLPHRKPLQENEYIAKPVLALFLLSVCSQATDWGAKSTCSSSRTDITHEAELCQDNSSQGHLLEILEGQEHTAEWQQCVE